MREHVKADEEFVREDVTAGPRSSASRRGPGLQGRADRGPRRQERRRHASRSTPTARSPTSAAGPHAPATERIKAFKLQSVAGAYWRGDATRTMLTRIYGTAFFSKDELAEHLERLEEAKPRDHRKLGRELGLFSFSELGPGSAFWPPPAPRSTTRSSRSRARCRRARLHGGQDAAALRQRAVEDLRPLGQVPREHVRDRDRGPADGAQADELPRPRAFSRWAALLPRAADPLRRARPAAPQRAERHAPRAAARAPLHPGRRPHLLHRGAGRGGGARLPRLRLRLVRPFGFDMRLELSTRPEQRIGTDEMWDRAEAALQAALDRGGSSTRSTRATAPSTGRRSTST